MRQASEDFKLFQRAFVEVMNEKEQAALDAFPGKPQYTKHHLREMKKILSGKRTASKKAARILPNKRLLAALIAAALLLIGGITVYAKRDAIVRFVTNIFDGYNKVTYEVDQNEDTDIPQEIEEERIPTYVPEGYVLQEKEPSILRIRIEWKKENQSIIFEQGTIEGIYDLDNEHSEQTALTVDNCPVYLQKSGDKDLYLWTDGEYAYSMQCFGNLSFDEVSKIIQSVLKEK